jgi:PIN domain nuclease of toxin-antitoxin system
MGSKESGSAYGNTHWTGTQAMRQSFPRRGLLDSGKKELPITNEHAVSIGRLPALHKDPLV